MALDARPTLITLPLQLNFPYNSTFPTTQLSLLSLGRINTLLFRILTVMIAALKIRKKLENKEAQYR